MRVGGQHNAPADLPTGKTRYPLYRRLGGPQGRSGLVQKISPPTVFDLRTVQPVASRYTDWAIPAAALLYFRMKESDISLKTLLQFSVETDLFVCGYAVLVTWI